MDASAVRSWCVTGLESLRRHREEIDKLNFFPVPDRDTGTNMCLTMVSAVESLEYDTGSIACLGAGTVLSQLARGALWGARGNSGIILAQFLRGFADSAADAHLIDGYDLAKGLDHACVAAYQAMAAPIEGTMLTVAAIAASAARDAHSSDAALVASVAASAAREAVTRTRHQLVELTRAGVFDAGGFGLSLFLDALVDVLGGHRDPRPLIWHSGDTIPLGPCENVAGHYAYEVQYFLETDDCGMRKLRKALGKIGDSVAIVGGEGEQGRPLTWNVHVHVNDVGAAIEAGVEIGRPHHISVTRFADQISTCETTLRDSHSGSCDRMIIVVCADENLRRLFDLDGVRAITIDEVSPSTTEFFHAMMSIDVGQIVVLPNAAESTAVAAAVTAAVSLARAEGIHVAVIRTRSPVQALAALAVHDVRRSFEDDVIAMAEAAGACRSAHVTRSREEALTVVGHCSAGDVLAIIDGEVNLIGDDVIGVSRSLIDRLLSGGGELATFIIGNGAPDNLCESLMTHLRDHWPFVEVQPYVIEHSDVPLLIGVE